MTAPLRRVLEQDVPAVAIAADDDSVLGQAPITGKVTSVTYIPEAGVAGVATNNRTLSLVNKKQNGTGTTVIATLTFASGTNAAAWDDRAIPLSSTATDLRVTEGDTLVWRSVHNGTGLADPGGVVHVAVDRA